MMRHTLILVSVLLAVLSLTRVGAEKDSRVCTATAKREVVAAIAPAAGAYPVWAVDGAYSVWLLGADGALRQLREPHRDRAHRRAVTAI